MTASADRKSTKADTIHKGGQRQRVDNDAFSERLRDAMREKGYRNSDLADEAEISRQLISEYTSGKKIAGADNLFTIADCLGVQARWLLRGEGERDRATRGATSTEEQIPKFDLFKFSEHGKPEPSEMVSIPTNILHSLKVRSGIWLAEMPSSAMPSLAQEGELLVCRDPDEIIQDRRVYVFVIDGRPLVRKAYVRPEGLQLRSEDDGDTILVTPSELEQIRPIGRVLSAISVHSA